MRLDDGAIEGIREITQSELSIDVLNLLVELGGQNIVPEPATNVLCLLGVLWLDAAHGTQRQQQAH